MSTIATILNGSCDETREHLSEHLEGGLHGWSRIRVLRHLRRCDRCREVLASLMRVVEQLRALGQTEPRTRSVAEAVTSRIREEEGP